MNHFILPFWDGDALCSPRYGNIAIPQLVKAFLRLDCQHNSLEAKVFGAAYTLPSQAADRDENHHNGLVTQKLLKELGIPIIAMDFGGDRGRHITFNTETGKVALKYLEKRSFT